MDGVKREPGVLGHKYRYLGQDNMSVLVSFIVVFVTVVNLLAWHFSGSEKLG